MVAPDATDVPLEILKATEFAIVTEPAEIGAPAILTVSASVEILRLEVALIVGWVNCVIRWVA